MLVFIATPIAKDIHWIWKDGNEFTVPPGAEMAEMAGAERNLEVLEKLWLWKEGCWVINAAYCLEQPIDKAIKVGAAQEALTLRPHAWRGRFSPHHRPAFFIVIMWRCSVSRIQGAIKSMFRWLSRKGFWSCSEKATLGPAESTLLH